MTRIVVGLGVVCVAAIAFAQPGNSVRLGSPLDRPNVPSTVSVATDADQPPGVASSPATAVLDAQLPKTYFDAGESVILTTHLRTRGGVDLDGGDMRVDDQASAGPMDHDSTRKSYTGQAKGHGQQQATLDNSPGEHFIVVSANALDTHGNSIHRAVAHYYVVGTGEIRFTGIGSVHPVGGALVVPLAVVAPQGGSFNIAATLASGAIAVARAETFVNLTTPGAATVSLYFQQSNIVEPGPYHLVNVTATGGNAGPGSFAAVPQDVGRTFQAAHAAGEPAPNRDAQGGLVGGPYGPGPDVAQPLPTPIPPSAPHPLAPGEQGADAPDPMPFAPPQ